MAAVELMVWGNHHLRTTALNRWAEDAGPTVLVIDGTDNHASLRAVKADVLIFLVCPHYSAPTPLPPSCPN